NIVQNKMRSFLTILGILIGVTAIISLITVMQGAISSVNERFDALGAGKLLVQAPGTALKRGLNDNDMRLLEQLDNINGISPSVTTSSSVQRGGVVEDNVRIEGRNDLYFKYNPDSISRGRSLNLLDMSGYSNVCIIDSDLSESLFFGEDPLDKTVILAGKEYTVVGITDSESVSLFAVMAAFSGDSTKGSVVVPYRNALKMTYNSRISAFEVYLSDPILSDTVIEDLEAVLNEIFNYNDRSFVVMNLDSLLDTMKDMQSMMTALLVGIASIALLVGGIGIMNMMLVTVIERTREIGLKKALGAEPILIQLQFLIEAIMLSVIGGILGTIVGLLISYVASRAIDIDFRVSLSAISLGVGFSALVGIVFGWSPARKASMLNPIDALRTE
ncbi:MAG: ABC transporter permease, partial [Clostridiales bacterium]|nr:ABC transporter permease [Clostridiales bacterium]